MQVSVGDAILHVEQHGTGPDLVMLHGMGLSSTKAWDTVVPELSKHYRITTYDLRGHARSTNPSAVQSIAQHAADLLKLLDHLGIAQTHLLGFSFTGLVVQQFILDHPERVRSLTLFSTTAQLAPEFYAGYRERASMVEKDGMGYYVELGMQRTFAPQFFVEKPDLAAWYREQFLANDPTAYAAAMLAMIEVDFRDRVKSIACPVLVIGGAEDASPMGGRVAAEGVRELHRLIPHSRLVIVPGVKHYVQLERPEAVISTLREFIDSVEERQVVAS